MTLLAWMLILSGQPQAATTRVDVLEHNAYIEHGEERFHQWIGWEWLPDYNRCHVVFWKFVEPTDYLSRGALVFASGGQEYRVQYDALWWTRTNYDPERRDALLLDANKRSGLNARWRCER